MLRRRRARTRRTTDGEAAKRRVRPIPAALLYLGTDAGGLEKDLSTEPSFLNAKGGFCFVVREGVLALSGPCGRLQGRPAVRSGPGPRLSHFVCARGLRGLSLVPKHQGCQGNFPLAIADLAIAIWQLPFGNCQLGNCQLGIFPSGIFPIWKLPFWSSINSLNESTEHRYELNYYTVYFWFL